MQAFNSGIDPPPKRKLCTVHINKKDIGISMHFVERLNFGLL